MDLAPQYKTFPKAQAGINVLQPSDLPSIPDTSPDTSPLPQTSIVGIPQMNKKITSSIIT